MIPSLLLSLALAPAATAAGVPAAPFELKLEDYAIQTEDYRFPSGLRILFQEDHTQPIVSITNWFDRGSIYDGENAAGESTEGVAHAVEHLAFRAKHGDLPKNWDVINQLGGVLNASTSKEWTNYMTVAPVDAAIPLIRLEALRMHDGVAGVTAADVEAEKSIVRNELRMGYEMGANGSPAIRTALLHIPKLLFPPDHPYQNSTIGSHETVSHIDLPTVQRFVRENYRPEYSTIAVVGDFDLQGGKGMAMIFQAFEGVEDLLMAPEDAAAYQKLTTFDEQQQFLQNWIPKLTEFLKMTYETPPTPRVNCDDRAEPPPLYSKEIIKVQGMVDHPTAIVAWSLPGGYCDDDPQKEIAARLLTNYIIYTLDPEYDPLSQEQEIENIGCFADVDKRATVVMCMVEKGGLAKYPADRLVDKVADALYLQWAPIEPIVKRFYDNNFAQARLSYMSSVLSQTDNVASLYGRSFFVSQHAHYTGSASFFSDTIQSYNTVQLEPVRELAKKYITRDRMAAMIIEPMDEEERERLEAGSSEADQENEVSGEHRAKDDKSRQLFDTDALTPEAIRAVTVVPDRAKMRELTLDNGLQVVIMDHGEAPLVKVGLQVYGGNADAPAYGLDSFANALHSTAVRSRQDPSTNPLAIAGYVGKDSNEVYASGSAGNLDALLHKMRWHVEDYDWEMADKAQQIKSWTNTAKSDGKEPETWASRLRTERLFPGSPYGNWMSPADYQAMKDWGLDDIKGWLFTKWQPANATLVVVGKLGGEEGVDNAEKLVRKFFEDWKYKGNGTPGPIGDPARPTAQPDRQVLLFDKPIATQSKVQLSCQLDKQGDPDDPGISVIGEALSFLAFERLREEKGLTYGAYAFPRRYRGDTTELIIASVIQNNGAAYGVQTMFDLVREAADGELDDGFIATNKWNVARTMVSSQQSGDQMLSTLLSPGRDNMDYFDSYAQHLGDVDAKQIGRLMQTCKGHELVTVVGPVDKLKPQFDEAKIPYEVVDWEALYESQLTPKEVKSYRKAKAKKEAEDAKKKDET
ncbi:MAG: insulinase family protein [Alphaproteobacteria bacterium]|nr:insulinase family protein [Alphaproteobacteria bacterium]